MVRARGNAQVRQTSNENEPTAHSWLLAGRCAIASRRFCLELQTDAVGSFSAAVTLTLDLFDPPSPASYPAWMATFDTWAHWARTQGPLSQGSSQATYRHLWEVLAKWCVSQTPPVDLDHLRADDLLAFIESRSGLRALDDTLSPRYVWRLLHLVERVLAHRSRECGIPENPAAAELLAHHPQWRHANAAHTDTLPECLTAAEARRLVNHLSEARPRPGGRGALHTWQELRNRAAVALQLGAGLGPGDVRSLHRDALVVAGGRLQGVPWKVCVPANGNAPAREAPIAAWAGRILRHWLEVRREQGLAGEPLFPSTRSGKPWGKVAQYQAAREVLEAAGIDDARGGSFRLRHTFALRQLRRGRPEQEVARWLGVVDPAVMARYRRVLMAPIDDVV